jgi:hypothetical protein
LLIVISLMISPSAASGRLTGATSSARQFRERRPRPEKQCQPFQVLADFHDGRVDFEKTRRVVSERAVMQLRAAPERAGVRFIREDRLLGVPTGDPKEVRGRDKLGVSVAPQKNRFNRDNVHYAAARRGGSESRFTDIAGTTPYLAEA